MDDITVVVPCSPIKSHPNTRIIDETINTLRAHLPTSEIIIQFDGVREEQKHYEEAYNQYKTEMLWRCLHQYKNVLPLIFEENLHQSGMMHRTMEEIKTPLLLYVEHDAPLTPDRFIDWGEIKEFIYDGEANTVRFHFEEVIPEPHKHLMLGEEDDFIRTIQWSQRPHLSTKVYYEELLKYFPPEQKTFIEDEWHGVVYNDYQKDGMFGWYKHRLWIYDPDDPIGMKRSYTTDGRENDPKFGEGFAK